MSTSTETRQEYPRPSLTADVVALLLHPEGRLSVLLIQRGRPPFQGQWAIPGGFCEPNESVEQAGARELEEETGMTGLALEQLAVFSKPGRDPRGWVVTVAFMGFVPSHRVHEVRGTDDASDARFWNIAHAPSKTPSFELTSGTANTGTLAFDHDEILGVALQRCRRECDRIAFLLLPEHFSPDQLQKAHEALLGEPVDGQALIKRLLLAGALMEREDGYCEKQTRDNK